MTDSPELLTFHPAISPLPHASLCQLDGTNTKVLVQVRKSTVAWTSWLDIYLRSYSEDSFFWIVAHSLAESGLDLFQSKYENISIICFIIAQMLLILPQCRVHTNWHPTLFVKDTETYWLFLVCTNLKSRGIRH